MTERDSYTCPLGRNRDGCACLDCLNWRYKKAIDERQVTQ